MFVRVVYCPNNIVNNDLIRRLQVATIEELVQSFIRGEEPPTEEIAQTFYLTLKGRAQLEALAQIAKRSKTRTGSQILQAALDQAIALLPDEPMMRGKFMLSPEQGDTLCTPQDFVNMTLRDWAYQDRLEAQGLLPDERLYTPEEADKLTGQKVGQA
jgi:hypothetical protein